MNSNNSDDDVFVVEPLNFTMPLDSDDIEYVRGIEVGLMYQSAFYGIFLHMKIHPESVEMMLRIVEAFDLTFCVEEVDNTDMLIVSLFPSDDYFDQDDDEDDYGQNR